MNSSRSFGDHIHGLINRVAEYTSPGRFVIIHNHIFKNAGSTIDWALQNNFGGAFVDHRDDVKMRKETNYLSAYLREHRRIIALSSHHLAMPLPSMPEVRLLTLMMFRHPVERVESVYNFERKHESDTHPGAIHARKYSLHDYIHWRMKPEVGATIRDFQTRKMLPLRTIGQDRISQDEIAQLKNQLMDTELLGLVGRFDESMVLFEEYLCKIFPNIDLSYVPQNVGQEPSTGLEARLLRLESEIGRETYDLLVNNNQQDLLLLEHAEKEIATRILKVNNFQEKLANFRARCAARLAVTS